MNIERAYASRSDVVNTAKAILDMNDEIAELRFENDKLRQYEEKYRKLVSESINHSQAMIGSVLTALIDKKVELPRSDEEKTKLFNDTQQKINDLCQAVACCSSPTVVGAHQEVVARSLKHILFMK